MHGLRRNICFQGGVKVVIQERTKSGNGLNKILTSEKVRKVKLKPKVEPQGRLPFEHNVTPGKNLVYKTTFS